MLLLSRFPGQGLYIGRGVRVTVVDYRGTGALLAVEHDRRVQVSGPEVAGAEHLRGQMERERRGDDQEPEVTEVHANAGEVVTIGRGILLTVLTTAKDAEVQLGVDAPQHVAVSRDDFTLDEHLRWQERREGTRTR